MGFASVADGAGADRAGVRYDRRVAAAS